MTTPWPVRDEAPTLAEYLDMRPAAGLSPVTAEQGAPALTGSWAWATVRAPDGRLAAMGRVIGDGGWCFHVADMATHPDHQRRGLGRAVLQRLLDRITAEAPERPYVTLMGDGPGRRLYSSMGFVDAMPHSMGMRWAPQE
ncbi:GNAT family N-acetyltransferase [Kytococcus sp. Marseille-QA3725]